MRNKHILESIGLHKIRFEDKHAFKTVIDSIANSRKMKKIYLSCMSFDTDFHGKKLGQALKRSQSIIELHLE